ncbi:MAG: class IV adenylate cyclase [Acidobacteriaceae bacterium]
MPQDNLTSRLEVEIKVRLTDTAAFATQLPSLGFHQKTAETLERNTLFDTPTGEMRRHGELLRVREYDGHWKLTHKAPVGFDTTATHKSRVETETEVDDGKALAAIFERLGYRASFIYEKFRAEWSDGEGDIVIDRTPIGDFAELEGEPDWIDRTASRLGISPSQYLTSSYGQLFLQWKETTGHPSANMTFVEIHPGKSAASSPQD